MNEKNNTNNDFPEWLEDPNQNDNQNEESISNENKEQPSAPQNEESNDDWLKSFAEKQEKEQTFETEDAHTFNEKDSTSEFLYEIENMIDDGSYLNIGDRSDRVADEREWMGWENDPSSDDDNDEWLSKFSQSTELDSEDTLEINLALSDEVDLGSIDEKSISSEEPQREISLEQNDEGLPEWLKNAKLDEVVEASQKTQEQQTKEAIDEIFPSEDLTNPMEEVDSLFEDLSTEEETKTQSLLSSDAIVMDDEEQNSFEISQKDDLPDWLKNVSIDLEEESKKEDTIDVFEKAGFDTGQLDPALPNWLKDEFENSSVKKETADLLGREEKDSLESSFAQSDLEPDPFLTDHEREKPTKKTPTQPLSEDFEDDITAALGDFSDDEIDDLGADDQVSENAKDDTKPFTQDIISLEKTDLPEWVKSIHPDESSSDIPQSKKQFENEVTVGPLAGLKDIIPAEPEIVKFSSPQKADNQLKVTQEQSRFAAVLDEIFDASVEQQKQKKQSSSNVMRGWLWIPFLLIVALMAANFINIPFVSAPMSPANLSFAQTIENLPEESNVLLVLDYQLGVYHELENGLTNIMHQFESKNSKIYTLTTKPLGNGLAQMMIFDHPTMNIQNLGYLTGNASAIAQFAYDVTTAPNALILPTGLTMIEDFDLVVVVTDGIQNTQNWSEQAGPALQQTPMLMISSAKIKPIVASYYQTSPKRIDGYLSGYFECETYQKTVNPSLAVDNETWDGVYLVTVMTIILLMVGSMISLMIHLFDGLKQDKEVKK